MVKGTEELEIRFSTRTANVDNLVQKALADGYEITEEKNTNGYIRFKKIKL